MKNLFANVFVYVFLFFAILIGNNSCDDAIEVKDVICVGGNCFSIEDFGNELNKNLQATTLGYSYAIYYKNSLRKWGNGGQARRSQDGNVFDINAINTDMNVASCAKSITAIATLQQLEANNLNIGTHIKNYLPQWWTFGSNIDKITFRDLLTQKSGFRPSKDAVSYSQIRSEVASGIKLSDYNKANYQNMNFCILRIIIPILTGDFDKNSEVSNATAEAQTTTAFIDYLRTNITNKLLVDFSCDNDQDIMYYNYYNPGGHGMEPGNECNHAGGGTLSMSANDLAKVMYNARYTDKLLSSNMQALMFSATEPLGCYNNETDNSKSWGLQFHHNGGFWDSFGRGAASCWYILSNDVVVAVSTNSHGGISGSSKYQDINDLIELSYDAAWYGRANTILSDDYRRNYRTKSRNRLNTQR